MCSARNGPDSDGLTALHVRLEAHFRDLQARRSELGSGAPIFALEHGLPEAERALLDAEVRSALSRGMLPRRSWLPLVVYAAELGYSYVGDEYWQTFESRTPGWSEHGDRAYIRTIFESFSECFGGARPSGRWANWFSIISWPITHAVLPTYLQRQLAKLLFEYRTALTAELLSDPGALGVKLAARAWHYSSRFQNFAQNTSLLGQVAAALLTGGDDESPYLLQSTLRRIVETLSEEQLARRWLQDARWTASRVRTHGFRPPLFGSATGPTARRETLPLATDPVVFLREGPGGWTAYLDLPDLSVLAERLPGIHEELGRLRARVAGAARPTLVSGQLLVSGQQIRLATWPDPQVALIQLEGGSDTGNNILADQCVLSPGPPWLFRVREPRFATEVRGKFVRPGHRYVLICRDAIEPGNLPAWITPAAAGTEGVHAYSVEVPAPVETPQLEALRLLGLGVQADVEVRPAGLVPAAWDGEGAAEWIAGEDAAVAVSTTRRIMQCRFEIDGLPRLLTWPDGQDEIFVTVSGLPVGTHEARVSLLSAEDGEPVARGTLILTMRAPHSRPSGGTLREGLAMLASPATPTLPELWDGRAAIQILGPAGIRAQVEIAMADRRSAVLSRHRFRTALPVELTSWPAIAESQLRGSPELRGAYDDAESCVITVAYPGLGMARLRCEREFAPLRWVVGSDRHGPFARLIDNTGGAAPVVERYGFSAPAQPERVTMNADERLRWPVGGLFKASVGSFVASVVLPPAIRNLADLQLANIVPYVPPGPRTLDGVNRLIELAALWASADLPSEIMARHQRIRVLRAVSSRIAGTIGGYQWAQIENRSNQDGPSLAEMRDRVAGRRYELSLVGDIARRLDAWGVLAPEERSLELGTVLQRYAPQALGHEQARVSELACRLASEPATLARWPLAEVTSAVGKIVAAPVIIRAARFTVLAIHTQTAEDTGSTYRGWEWT